MNEVGSIATDFSVPSIFALPGANVTSFDCSIPCTSVEVAGFAVGLTATMTGVYSASTDVPFVSWRWTLAGWTGPT